MSTTPNRKTHVTLDPPADILLEPVMAFQRDGHEMARGSQSSGVGCFLIPQCGWQLEPLQHDPGQVGQLSQPQSTILGPAQTVVPAGWIQQPRFGQLNEAGIGYGAGVVTSGDLFWMKQVKAGDDWSSGTYALTADQSAYPAPWSAAQPVPVDRVAMTNSAWGPDEGFAVRLDTAGAKATAGEGLAAIGFCGPAGSVSGGIGQYFLCLGANGLATLYEQSGGQWMLCGSKPYGPKQRVSGSAMLIIVQPSTKTLNPALNGVILIEFEQIKPGPEPAASSSPAVPNAADLRQWLVSVPKSASVPVPSPLRLDLRRDMRIGWQITSFAYPTSAILQDDPFSFPFFASSTEPIILAWFSDEPTGTSVAGVLHDGESGAPLTQVGSVAGYPMYQANPGQRTYFARFTLTGSPSTGMATSTPTLFGYRVQRDAVFEPSALVPTDISGAVTHIEVSQTDSEVRAGWAKVHVQDVQNTVGPSLNRGQRRILIETEFDATNPLNRACLFEGEIGSPQWDAMGHAGSIYPSPNWNNLNLVAVSPLARLMEAASPMRFDFGKDFNGLDAAGHPLPFLVTDALMTLFAAAGFDDQQVALAPSTLRLFETADPQGLILEPQVRLGEVILRWVRDYLGGRLSYDGDAHQWRVLPLIPSGAPVGTFQLGGPGNGKLVNALTSYPAATAFIRKGSLRQSVVPPVANAIVGYGLAANANGYPRVLVQTAINTASLTFEGVLPNPIGLDYLERYKPLFLGFPGESTANGLNWMVRRAYDLYCHGKQVLSWQAPLLLIANSNGPPGSQRALRPGDLVSANGITVVLTEVRPDYGKDQHQLSFYEGETVSA